MTRDNQSHVKKAQPTDTNLVVVVGTVSKDALVTEAADGRVFTSFDVICRTEGVRTVVPVTIDRSLDIAAGSRVAVLGRAEKRFFPSGAGYASRTDVRAETVTVLRRSSQLARVFDAAKEHLSAS